MELEDHSTKKPRITVAAASRPAHEIRAQDAARKDKKPQGRKKTKPEKEPVYANWHSYFLWQQILNAVKSPEVGPGMSATKIVRLLRKRNLEAFKSLSRSTVQGWIDYKAKDGPCWTASAIEMAEKNYMQGGHSGRLGVLVSHSYKYSTCPNATHSNGLLQAKYPLVVDKIAKRLEDVRAAKAPLSLVTIRGIFIATLVKEAPEVLETVVKKDGSKFHCSDSFLRKWLHDRLRWSERCATREANKLPEDWEAQCLKAFLRIAHAIKEYDIPSELIVNTDQTQLVYAPGSKLTWARTGSKQVSVIGLNEKRALTLVVSVANGGEFLPFQSIYAGKTTAVTPSNFSKKYVESKNTGFRWEYSETKTYWSTQRTMHLLVDNIIAPYFARMKSKLGLPDSQRSLWQIDAWSVHRSEEFREWMREHHPNILI